MMVSFLENINYLHLCQKKKILQSDTWIFTVLNHSNFRTREIFSNRMKNSIERTCKQSFCLSFKFWIIFLNRKKNQSKVWKKNEFKFISSLDFCLFLSYFCLIFADCWDTKPGGACRSSKIALTENFFLIY